MLEGVLGRLGPGVLHGESAKDALGDTVTHPLDDGIEDTSTP